MNKKVIISLIVAILIVILGIGIYFIINDTNQDNPIQNSKNLSDNEMNLDGKVLVTYFSHSGANYSVGNVEKGNTKMMAEYIIDYLNADLFEIMPNKTYPTTYDELVEVGQYEQRNNIKVDYVGEINIDDYDIIFLGYPIWDGEIPMVVEGFIDNHNFDEKVVIPFNTHAGSGNAGTYKIIEDKLFNSTVMKGLPVKGETARTNEGKSETIKWLEELGFKEKTNRENNVEKTSVMENNINNIIIDEKQEEQKKVNEGEKEMPILNIKIGNKNFTATLYDNETTRELIKQMPLTINMSELHGNEKYYYFNQSLPTNSKRVGNIKNGDLMLYGSDCFVLFYESFSTSYSYTRIGKIDNPSGLANAVGSENVEVMFSID